MKCLLFVLLLTGLLISSVYAEENTLTKSTTSSSQTIQPPAAESKWYYGGTLGFNFWNDYFYLNVQPMVGYKVSPKFSVGGKIGYSYINYNDIDLDTHNYGASIFSRYRLIPQIYLHGEFVYWSYETISGLNFETERSWVPFLLLGGGYVQNIGPNTSLYVEVLVDVLQDENSPYEDWDPFVSFGVGVGF